MYASAEVIVLRTGEKKEGTVIFRNEEVVVFKDATGARFQYPMQDVEAVLDALPEEEPMQESTLTSVSLARKVSVGIQLMAGGAAIPGDAAGVGISADLVIGTANLFDKQVFLGGGIGYHGSFMGEKKTYAFMPIQLRGEVPLMRGKNNMPQIGLGVGYGISLQKSVKGGAFASVDIGWRHRLAAGRALYVGLNASAQQMRLNVQEKIGDDVYVSMRGRCMVRYGAKLAFYL